MEMKSAVDLNEIRKKILYLKQTGVLKETNVIFSKGTVVQCQLQKCRAGGKRSSILK